MWNFRHVERSVKFDNGLNCIQEIQKSYGQDIKQSSVCWGKEVHWNQNTNPQCQQVQKSNQNVDGIIDTFWNYYNQFSVYQGQVDDPYFATGLKFHRAKHATQNRWIWFRTSDKEIVYEQFYDGSSNSWVKYFEGGISENKFLFTSDFRLAKCSNPFVALPAAQAPVASFFEEAVPLPAPISLKKKEESWDEEFYKWMLQEYDTDKDGEIDETELARLLDDIENWDIGKENIVKISEVSDWLRKYDTNGNRKLSIDEIIAALT